MYCMSFWMVAYQTAVRMDNDANLLPMQIQAANVCVAQHTV
jgi:hypothetical protein